MLTETLHIKSPMQNPPCSNNTIGDMKEDGIYLESSALSSIIGNLIQICGDAAIYLQDSAHITVEDNALANSYWGIYSDEMISIVVR